MPLGTPFRHEAFLYDSDETFARVLSIFVREGLENGEDTLVALNRTKLAILRDALGDDAAHVRFAAMETIGRNPACIIPAWREFVDTAASDRVRGIGEPIWAGRSAQEIVECHVHESLLNVAFEERSDFWLVCPYDTSSLPSEVIERAGRTHPMLRERDAVMNMNGQRSYAEVFDDPLPEPVDPSGVVIRKRTLGDLRAIIGAHAIEVGLDPDRARDVVLAVSELAANSVRYGGGQGELYFWIQDGVLMHEVRDNGKILEPLIGRSLPPPHRSTGRGLWLVNQLCDLVQIRSGDAGTIVRIHNRI